MPASRQDIVRWKNHDDRDHQDAAWCGNPVPVRIQDRLSQRISLGALERGRQAVGGRLEERRTTQAVRRGGAEEPDHAPRA